MTLYEVFKYTKEQIVEIEDLLDIADKLDVQTIQESLFQFSPRLVKNPLPGFGEHETWYNFHKDIIVSDIVFRLLEYLDYDEDMIYDMTCDQINESKYSGFIRVNMKYIDADDIIEKFKKYVKDIECKN